MARAPASKTKSAPSSVAKPFLAPTHIPGVFLNAHGLNVDEYGILIAFRDLQLKHSSHEVSILGKAVETPAEVLQLAALDRNLPLSTRLSAAKDAAPYFNRKKPVAIDGGEDAETGKAKPITVKNLRGLDDAELSALETLLGKATAHGDDDATAI